MKGVFGNALELGEPDFCQSSKAFDAVDMGWAIDMLIPGMRNPVITLSSTHQPFIAAPAIGVDDERRVNSTPLCLMRHRRL